MSEIKKEQVARMCHEVNRAYCEAIGHTSQTSWNEAPEWQKESARKGVQAHVDSNFTMKPEDSHNSWLAEKEKDGWVYGEVKDLAKRTHPCMLPYSELPVAQRTKDYLFGAVVHTSYLIEPLKPVTVIEPKSPHKEKLN